MQIQMKLVAVAHVEFKEGQEIDVTITVPETGFYTAEIAQGLVALAHSLPDPNEPTGRAAVIGTSI